MRTMTETFNDRPKPRRPATLPHSRSILRQSVRPRSAAAISPPLLIGALIGSLLLVSGCRAPELLVLSADRQIVREADGTYRVSDVWMQERYQLERALRLRLERCEAGNGAGGPPSPGRQP